MADERRNIDTDTKKDAEQQKQGTGIQAATDKRDESIVAREEGGAVEHKTPGPRSRRGDKHDLPLTGEPLVPGSRKTTIIVENATVKAKTEGGDEREGIRALSDMGYEDLLVLANQVRQEAGNR